MSYYKYLVKKVLTTLVSVFFVIVISFFITRALPGDPVWLRLPPKATLQDYVRERKRLGLDKPIIYQFFVYMIDLLTGNWGYSLTIAEDSSVWSVINLYLPRTLEVLFISMFIAVFLGIKMGKISAKKANSFRDIVIKSITYFILAIPGFIIVLFFIQIYFQIPFKLFPLFGYKNPVYPEPPSITNFRIIDSFISGKWYLLFDYMWHLVIPISAMSIVQMVIIIRYTRASILETSEMDFIRVLKSKGLSKHKIMKKHVMKNSFPPIITASAMSFPLIIGGTIAVEISYHFVGLGFMFREAVRGSDYTIFIAIIFIFSLLVICFNFIVDLIIGYLDPRIRFE
ncbi:MAG: ABC transporter permease subunit [Candidatus Lokiarchaeota archaeon]|nr:ABC transporter permease subunit [Candidatus Lokiarchaeota archaeon]